MWVNHAGNDFLEPLPIDTKLMVDVGKSCNGGKTKKDTNVRMFVCTQNLNEWS